LSTSSSWVLVWSIANMRVASEGWRPALHENFDALERLTSV
jgi:hypothetical protein